MPIEISPHLLKVYAAVKDSGGWLTNEEIVKRTGVAARTSRLHTRRLSAAGVFDSIDTYPWRQYRLSPFAEQRAPALVEQLEQARAAARGEAG